MLIAIIGASGTGKTTISREMTENFKFGEITSYTTRSMRPGEKQDADYHFVDLDSFKQMIEEDKFVEYEEYTQNRFYGTAKEDIKNAAKSDKVYSVVVTPGGMRNIKSYLEKEGLTDNFKSVLVTAPLGTRINRYINRQGESEFTFDDMNEIFSRVNRDYGMFLNLEKEVDLCIENDGKKTPKELTADIVKEFKCVTRTEYLDYKKEIPDKTLKEQLDLYFNKKLSPYENIKICNTPLLLQMIGCKDYPMLYTQKHLKLALKNTKSPHTHNLTRKIIENIEPKISNPIMIADSLTDNKSIVILTDQLDESDNLILVSIKPDGKGIYNTEIIDSNFITSIYGKRGYEKYIQKNIDEGTVLYLNTKKIRDIPSLLKLQLPQRFGFASNDIYIIKESENICNIKADKNFLHPEAKENELTGDYGMSIDRTDSEMELEIPEPFEEIEEEQFIEEDLEEGLPF